MCAEKGVHQSFLDDLFTYNRRALCTYNHTREVCAPLLFCRRFFYDTWGPSHSLTLSVWEYCSTGDFFSSSLFLSKIHITLVFYRLFSTTHMNVFRYKPVFHVVWTEQPEGIVTALATAPIRRSDAGKMFKKCELYR